MRTKQLLLPILCLFCMVGMASATPKAGGRKAIEKTAIVPPVKYQAVLRDGRGYCVSNNQEFPRKIIEKGAKRKMSGKSKQHIRIYSLMFIDSVSFVR